MLEWFVEGMIGLDSRLKHHPCQSALTADDVMIDDTGTIRINPSPLSPPSPLTIVTPTFSADLKTYIDLFETILEKLQDSFLLLTPRLDLALDRTKNIVISLLNSFFQSEDINTNVPLHRLPHIVEKTINLAAYRNCPGDTPKTKGWTFFCRILAEVDPSCGQLRPSTIFDEDGGPSEHSKNLIETSPDADISKPALDNVKAKTTFLAILDDIPDQIPQNVTGLSFIREKVFRETLVRLQSKYQKRIIPKINPLLPVSSSPDKAMPSTTRDDQINPQFKQTPDDESIATQEVRSGFGSLHPSTLKSVQSDDSHSTCVNSDQSTSASITLQTDLPPSEDTDPLLIEPASTINHSLSARFPSATESDEAMAMISLLHSLLSAPPIARTIINQRVPQHIMGEDDLEEDENFDVTERFSVTLFDEDDESLFKSLTRCSRMCELVPPDQCISDIPAFVDMLITSLTSTSPSVTDAASNILSELLSQTLDFREFLQNHWNEIKTAFRDGSIGARMTLIHVVTLWRCNHQGVRSTHPNLYKDFDLDGIASGDTASFRSFYVSLLFLLNVTIHLHPYYTSNYLNSLLLSFEEKQHASARIWKYIVDEGMLQHSNIISSFITFCLDLSLHFGHQLQPDLFDYILTFPNLHSAFQKTNILPSFLLNHTSINIRSHQQQACLMQLLFEQTLRSDPSTFYLVDTSQNEDLFSEYLQTPLVGLHSLFLRGVHPQPYHVNPQSLILSIHNFIDDSGDYLLDHFHLYALFPPPLIIQFYSNLIIQLPSLKLTEFAISQFLLPFLATCGPFGECRSLFSLIKSLLASLPNNEPEQNMSRMNIFLLIVIGLHWFSLPLSFKSPFLLLPHIISHFPDIASNINPWDLQQRWDVQIKILFSATAPMENDIILHVSELAITLGLLSPILNTSSASVYSRCGLTSRLCRLLISPVPSIVSLVLAFLARLVQVSNERGKMEMVQLGVIDCVVVAVSQSSFLEDYENGIALIGDLLRAVRQDEQCRRMILFDFALIY
ncbi:hypothetical protein BLNAU_14507 [Blattamonas nauphoetae]|uniref:Uncharacterized protein n=1 Tax=Blattamonas nauphoetae TaxID=2049346 RepID=A0ABQ9XI59_9EUKA|nr:hypothetical protein BLNAU_14507 [Blattamonas nauphoetae]